MKGVEGEEFFEAYRENLLDLSVTRIRLCCFLAIVLVPLFSIIDYFLFPDLFSRFFAYRLICAAVESFFIIVITYTSSSELKTNFIGVCVPLVVAGMLSLIINETGGYLSPYYAGLNLVILAITFLYVLDIQITAAICIIIFGLYILPVSHGAGIEDPGILINNIAYILSSIAIGLTSAFLISNLRYQEFKSLLRLDQSQKALQESNDKLRELGVMKDDFFADISHELRTPLAIIRGEAEVSLRGKEKPVGVYKEVLQYIVEISEQMNQLVGDLLLLARSESGTVTIEKKVISLTQVLNKAFREGGALADKKGVPLHYSAESDEDFVIQGDQARLVQLFLIILDNAVKYSNKCGEIRISSQRQGDRVRITVLDAGVGIPEEDLPHIFDRFYRAGKTKSMSRKGTGLGLSIARWIVEAHDGEIVVDSTVNKGTTMMIFLPLFRDRSLKAGKA